MPLFPFASPARACWPVAAPRVQFLPSDRAHAARPVRRSWPAWAVALVLVAISSAQKMLLVLAPSEHVSPAWVEAEELHRGNIAREILEGPLLPLQDFHHAANVGGSVVVGALAAPSIALFGDSIVSVRLVPVLFNAACVLLAFLILERTYGRRAAWIGGLLVALTPPGYSLVSITAWGTHHEGNALSLACVLLYLGLRRGRDGSPREPGVVRASALGLVAGFATYFGYTSLLALGALAVFELLHDKLFFARRWFAAAAVGYALGFLPWIAYNLAHDFSGLSIYGQPLEERVRPGGMLENLRWFAASFLPESLFFRVVPEPWGRALAVATCVALAGAVALAAWSLRRPLRDAARALVRVRAPRPLAAGIVFLLYLPLFAVAIASFDVGQWGSPTGIAHDGRYATPLYPFVALAAGVGLGQLARRGRVARAAALAIAGSVLLASGAGTLAACDFGRLGEGLSRPGTSNAELARFLTWKYRDDVGRLERIWSRLESRPLEQQDRVAFALAQGLKASLRSADLATTHGRSEYRRYGVAFQFLAERVPPPFRVYFAPTVPGERAYGIDDRERYWLDRRARQREGAIAGSEPPGG